MDREPIQIGLMLSGSFGPALNKAYDVIRARLPKASDGEIIEQIFFAGIVATIESVEKQQRVQNKLRAAPANS